MHSLSPEGDLKRVVALYATAAILVMILHYLPIVYKLPTNLLVYWSTLSLLWLIATVLALRRLVGV